MGTGRRRAERPSPALPLKKEEIPLAKKNDWVRIHRNVLNAEDRTGKLPDDTKKVPLEMWVKGHLVNDSAEIGDEVTIITRVGREEHGKLHRGQPPL